MAAALTFDVLIVGGGIIGAAIAERLARDGRRVGLVERGRIGAGASWAAAGLLTPVHPWNYPEPLLRLDAESLALWPGLVERLLEETGTDLEFRRTGAMALIESDEDVAEARRRVDWKLARDEPAAVLTQRETLLREPVLSPAVRGALWLPDLAQIRSHRAAPALAAAARRRGATVLEDTQVHGLVESARRVVGVRTAGGEIAAGVVVLAAGAWSGSLTLRAPQPISTIPARGEMLLLRAAPGALGHMILAGGQYLVPRADGCILAGSTVDYAGFESAVTAAGRASIAAGVRRMSPVLAEAPVETAWAGLRPDTPDHLPHLGEVMPGLIAATGHFRSGIMLAPVTAEIVRDLIDGRTSRDLAAFSPARATAS